MLLIVALLAVDGRAQNPYIREDSIGATPKAQTTPDRSDPFSLIPVEEWLCEKFIFMPRSGYDSKQGYRIRRRPTSDISYIPYARYKGKVVTVLQVTNDVQLGAHNIAFRVDDTQERFITTDFLGFVPGWALKRDIDYARHNFIGKTLWLRNREVSTYDAATKKTEDFKVNNLQPVKVIDIVLSDTEGWPLRFVLEDKEGKKFFKVSKLSGTNCDPVLESAYKFNDVFFTDDPRKRFAWDEATFTAIEDGKVFVGMSKEQARISWGNPLEINRTVSGDTVREQWVYGGNNYLYFDRDKLTSIQD